MKNQLIYALILVLAGFTQTEAANKCTITGTVNASTLATYCSTLSDGDTLYIGSSSDTLIIDAHNTIYAATKLVVYIVDSGVVYWIGNYTWSLGDSTKLIMENGGDLYTGSASLCSANKKLKIGSQNIASCSGNGATFSFNQLVNGGGFDIENPLPVELLSFEHIVVSTDLSGSVIELNWQTASEINNDRFEVYRSIDGVDFNLVQVVPGVGTSSNINTYSTLDKAAHISTTLYYKLVQIDFDGTSETFKILRVNLSNLENQVSIYPNPAHDQIEFRITNPSNFSTEITITNLNGEVVLTETVNNSLRLDVSEWRTGLYFLRATANNTEVVNRIIIIN
jgi:hypothetical protein